MIQNQEQTNFILEEDQSSSANKRNINNADIFITDDKFKKKGSNSNAMVQEF